MSSRPTTGVQKWVLIATSIAGLVAAIFVAWSKWYEVHKARAEALEAEARTRTTPALPALKGGSMWEGTFTLKGRPSPYPGTLSISDRTGDTFRGTCTWGEGKNEEAAEVEGKVSGMEITFRELRTLKGTVFAVPCIWTATVSEDHMKGTWARGTNGSGSFDFVRRKPE